MGLCVSKDCGRKLGGGATVCKSRYPDPPSFNSFLNCPAAAVAGASSSSSPLTPRASSRPAAGNLGHVSSQVGAQKKKKTKPAVEGTKNGVTVSVATADWSARDSVFEKIAVSELEEGAKPLEHHPTGMSEEQFRDARKRPTRCNGMVSTHQSSVIATPLVEGPRSNVSGQEMTSSLRIQLEQGLSSQRRPVELRRKDARPRREDATPLCENSVSLDLPSPVMGSSEQQQLGESKECALDRVPYKAASGKLLQGKIGVEKEHIKRSPLKPLNSNVYYVHDVPIIKMLPQAADDNVNDSSGAIDDQSLALATVQLEFTSDGSSKAERELKKSLKHESCAATNVCEAEDQDEGVCKSADREEALQSSSPVIKMTHDNLVSGAMAQVAIDGQEASAAKDSQQFSDDKFILECQELLTEDASLPGSAAASSPTVKDQVLNPSGPVPSEDSVLQCVKVNMPAEKLDFASSNLVVSSKILEEVKASHRESAEAAGANAKSRDIPTHVADNCLEDEEKRKMVHHHHLNYLIETRDVEEVSGDQAEFIEIVLNAELGGSLTKMGAHSNKSAEKFNQQKEAGLSEGVEPRRVQGETMDPCIDSEMILTRVGEDCHIQAEAGRVTKHLENSTKEHELDVRHPDGAGDAERNLMIVDSREASICGFDIEDLQVEGQSPAFKQLQGVTEEPHHVTIEQHPTLQDEMEKETLPSEVLLMGTSAESKMEINAPLLWIPEITPNVPDCFTAGNQIPAALEQQDDGHFPTKDVPDVHVDSRESEVDARLQISNDSVALQKLVQTSDTGQLDSDAQASSTYSSEGSTEVPQIVKAFHEAEKLPEHFMASFAETCKAENDNVGSSDLATYSPTHTFLKHTMTSSKDSTDIDIVPSLNLPNEDVRGNEEAAVRYDHLNDHVNEYNVVDPLGVLTPTHSNPQLSRDTSPDTSAASTPYQLTSHLLPVTLTAEEIAEIWGEFGESLAPYSTPSTP
ncbi:unnamed protein product [Sphagnum jensenii]|uniref:Uncharacterized protein n=1 Tax=Sphagnum jensenii TaxID=128206 RepID=A0ABP1BQV9_9BRYO